MRIGRALLGLLLFAYPSEFRREYRAQILSDLEEGGDGASEALRAGWDVLAGGIAMRAESLWRDLRYAARSLWRAPLFTFVVVGTLALAIAANAVVFSILDAVVLQPLPYANTSRLALLWSVTPAGAPPGSIGAVSMPVVRALAHDTKTFAGVAGSSLAMAKIRVDGVASSAREMQVTRNYFDVLGIRPELGRFFVQRGSLARSRALVISEKLWRRDYAGSADVLGKPLAVKGKTYTIIGVAPGGMLDPTVGSLGTSDLWTVMPRNGGNEVTFSFFSSKRKVPQPPAKREFSVFPIVRVRSGVSMRAAQADANRVAGGLERESHAPGTSLHLRVQRLSDAVFHTSRQLLFIIFAAVVGILLIACANVANLLLARGDARAGELAIRTSLGASARQVSVQLLTELSLLAVTGAFIGVVTAWAVLPAALALMPANLPRLDSTHIDDAALLYVAFLVILVTVLAGLAPAFSRARAKPADALRAAGKNRLEGGSHLRVLLVATEVAIAFTLVVCSGLLLRSLVTLSNVSIGFDARGLHVVSLAPLAANGPPGPGEALQAQRLAQRLRALPGVSGASIATMVPFDHTVTMTGVVQIQGRPAAPANRFNPQQMSAFTEISPGYLVLMHIPVLRGRGFTKDDHPSEPIVLVNEAFVKRFFPGGDALGQRLIFGRKALQIVGIVGDTRDSLTQAPHPLVYQVFDGGMPFSQIVLRTRRDATLARDVLATVKRLSPGSTPVEVQSLQQMVMAGAARTRSSLELLGMLAGIALLLALAGIYSVVSYSAQRRYHEIGIRMALGARPVGVMARVVGGAVVQSAIGIAAGIVVAAFATRALESRLFETSPLDPATFAAVVALLLGCTALAAFVPAWRASRVDPTVSLRYE